MDNSKDTVFIQKSDILYTKGNLIKQCKNVTKCIISLGVTLTKRTNINKAHDTKTQKDHKLDYRVSHDGIHRDTCGKRGKRTYSIKMFQALYTFVEY